MKTKLLILGSTGFIGKNLSIYFSNKKKYSITAVYNKTKPIKIPNIKYIKGDLTKKKFVENIVKNFDLVIQAAATTSGSNDIVNRPYIHVTDNIIMNSHILRSCFRNNIRHFIFFSCTTMYHSSKKPLKENDYKPEKKLENKYFGVANTKLYIEKMCEFFSKISKCKFTVIRHSNIYGQYDKFDLLKSHVFGASIRKILTAKKNIKVWGTGKEERDLLHIDDLMNFVEKSFLKQKSNFEIFNCGYGSSISISNLIKKMIKISNKKINIIYDKTKPTIPTYLSVDCNKAYKLLKWKKQISLDNGILMTLNWVKKNIKL